MKKGFTLVELLGVIILLGIVGLIITPNIIEIQNRTKIDAFEQSVNTLLRSAQIYHANNNYINFPESGLASNSSHLNLKNNDKFTSGMIKLIDNSYFYADNISDGSFCAVGIKNDLSVVQGPCPETPDRCYDFDIDTGTVLKFRRDKKGCDIANPTVPEKINGKVVENIGFGAFTEYGYLECSTDNWSTKYRKEKDYVPELEGIEKCAIRAITTKEITSISLPKTLKTIHQEAFAFTGINIADFSNMKSLEVIGYGSFYGSKIKTVNISNLQKLRIIDDEAFGDTTELQNITISNNPELSYIGYDSFYATGATRLVLNNLPKIITLKEDSFYESMIEEAVISNLPLLKTIEAYTFYYSELTNLVMEGLESLETIDQYAFAKNDLTIINLKNLTNLKYIGSYAFQNNKANTINLINLPKLVSNGIWSFAANNTKNLNIQGLTNFTTIGAYSFHGDYITSLDLSEMPNLKTIETQAFYCNSIETINFNNPKLTTIGNYAFIYSPTNSMNLESTGVTTIGTQAFARHNMTRLVLPASLISMNQSFLQDDRVNTLTSITVLGTNPLRFNSNWTSYGFPAVLKPS